MFIRSKYIFETKRTRLKRYGANICISFFLFFTFYTIMCLIFISVSNKEGLSSETKLFNRSPDLIVIFTGDKGRIPLGIEMAEKYHQSHIFITGVFSKNSVDTLLDPMKTGGSIDRNFLEIDYLARNTFENALSTYRYVQNNTGLDKILIISHDYHIMRIKKLMEAIQKSEDPYEFYYRGVKTDYRSFRNIKLLYKEVFKLLRTYLFLLMWNRDLDMPVTS